MQQAIPFKKWTPGSKESVVNQSSSIVKKEEEALNNEGVLKRPKDMVSENAVLVLGRRGCCMCHVMKQLLLVHGVNPVICEVDQAEEIDVVNELGTIGSDREKNDKLQFPSVYIGGKLFGDLNRLIAAHISGELVPILKQAGALWL
ncbi:hypothetical protein IFM89_014380 [Coptis chinensis]|uniref:Glutaredoxin domain-containing protein n=1 Tax=Coptis chinensis TaxID=261450 RepID=A0A835GWF6_9MAGN|nr:hypothetical protein IFM89_014380 [Coptis chinensis]